ncbi:MAG TPA: glucose-6-phosphate dehydrogenase assembly protein OpcA [Gaiella sp.]
MGVVAEIERKLARERCKQVDDGVPELRTSTLTHLVWAPPSWLPAARRTLAGLAERHPARTIFLVPEAGRGDRVDAAVSVRDFPVGDGREVLSEVIEIRLRGTPAEHPGSIVLPLLVSDLPAFCRWRGRPDFGSSAFTEIVDVVDRLVVDSGEWPGLPAAYARLVALFDEVTVSDIAYRRTLPWRARIAERWPDIASLDAIRVTGPRADALLLAGWLRSRLGREVRLSRRNAARIEAVALDGEPVSTPVEAATSPSDLLSGELEVLARDAVYEGAVRTLAEPAA